MVPERTFAENVGMWKTHKECNDHVVHRFLLEDGHTQLDRALSFVKHGERKSTSSQVVVCGGNDWIGNMFHRAPIPSGHSQPIDQTTPRCHRRRP
jgi:hypothetical protein